MSLISAPAGQRKTSCLPHLTHDPTSADHQAQVEVASPLTFQRALDELRSYGRRHDLTLLLDDLAATEKRLGENHPEVADALKSLVQRCLCLGKYREAEALSRRALEICEKVRGTDHLDVAEQLHALAGSCWTQEKYDEAEPYYQRAIVIYETKLAPDDIRIANEKLLLGSCYYQKKKYSEAEALFERVLQIYELKCGPNDPWAILAKKLLDLCKNNGAEELVARKRRAAHEGTSDADDKFTHSPEHAAAKKAKIVNEVDLRATSLAALAVAPTPMPSSSSSDETVPKKCSSLIERLVADARAKTAEIDRQLIDQINEITRNSHSNLKRRIEELQVKNANQCEQLCRDSRTIEELTSSQLRYEQIIAKLETNLNEKAQQLSSSEEKNKDLERSRQETIAKLETERNDKARRLSEAEVRMKKLQSTSERTIAELKAEIVDKSNKLIMAEQTIESHLSCSVCKDEDANRMWSKCHHVATCEQCATKLIRKDKGNSGNGVACPKCRTPGFPLEVFI